MSIFKKDPKKPDGSSKPPEKEFFDPPEGEGKPKAVPGLVGSHSIKIIAAGTVLMVLFLALFYPRPDRKRKTVPDLKDEKRMFVTTASMEQAIDGSVKGKKSPMISQKDERSVRRDKRKYSSDIAVFVLGTDKQKEPSPQKRSKREEISLGLPSGTRIPALLSNQVFSFNVEAPVMAILAKDFVYKDQVVIPKDSRFLGGADVIKSVDRINVKFDLLILPDGTEIRVRALALSEDGSAGIRGKVDKHTDRKIFKAIGETLLAGASLFTGGRQVEPFSLEDQMRMNLAQNLTDEAARDLRSTKIEKSITVKAYTPIEVILLEAI